jgi:hypothetical protein
MRFKAPQVFETCASAIPPPRRVDLNFNTIEAKRLVPQPEDDGSNRNKLSCKSPKGGCIVLK